MSALDEFLKECGDVVLMTDAARLKRDALRSQLADAALEWAKADAAVFRMYPAGRLSASDPTEEYVEAVTARRKADRLMRSLAAQIEAAK